MRRCVCNTSDQRHPMHRMAREVLYWKLWPVTSPTEQSGAVTWNQNGVNGDLFSWSWLARGWLCVEKMAWISNGDSIHDWHSTVPVGTHYTHAGCRYSKCLAASVSQNVTDLLPKLSINGVNYRRMLSRHQFEHLLNKASCCQRCYRNQLAILTAFWEWRHFRRC